MSGHGQPLAGSPSAELGFPCPVRQPGREGRTPGKCPNEEQSAEKHETGRETRGEALGKLHRRYLDRSRCCDVLPPSSQASPLYPSYHQYQHKCSAGICVYTGPQQAWQDPQSTGPEVSPGREGSSTTPAHPGKVENRVDASPLPPSTGTAQPRGSSLPRCPARAKAVLLQTPPEQPVQQLRQRC